MNESLDGILKDILEYLAKKESQASLSAFAHLDRAIANLHKLCPEYSDDDFKRNAILKESLENYSFYKSIR